MKNNTNDAPKEYAQSKSDGILAHALIAMRYSKLQSFHTFVETKPICSKKKFNYYFKKCFLTSPLYLDSQVSTTSLDEFLARVWAIEDSGSSSKNKGTKSRYLYFTRIMLPTDLFVTNASDAKRVEQCLIAINKELCPTPDGDLPFFYGYATVQKCTYVYLFHSERYYYPNGHKHQLIQARDLYRQKGTGYMCKPDDPDAYLSCKKGTVLKEDVIYLTKKYRIFNYSSKSQKMALRNKMKDIVIEHLYNVENDHFSGGEKEETLRPHFGRLSYDDVTNTDIALKYIEWNKVLIKCEDELEKFINGLVAAGYYEHYSARIRSFIAIWREKTLQREQNIPINKKKKRKMYIRFNVDFDSFCTFMHEGIEFVFMHALENLQNAIQKDIVSEFAF